VKYNELTIEELEEISGVDNPAQVGARAVIFKREFSGERREELAGEGAALPDGSFPVETVEDLRNAIQAIGRAKDQNKAIAHIKRRAVALGASELLPESFGKNTPGQSGNQENQNMTDKTPAEKELEAVNKQLAAMTVELAIAKAEGIFSDAEKVLYGGMDAAAKEQFRKLSAEQRAEQTRKSAESNPVVYTTLDGETFRKNDDPRLVAIAKRADEDRKALVAERAGRRTDEFKKRVESELKNLPGDEVVKVAVLRAVDAIQDEVARKGALALLKAGNDALSKTFETRGTTEGSEGGDAHEKLEKIAKELRAKNPKLGDVDAYVLASEQNPELYAEAISASPVQ
jgi:hypothetical protein